VTKNSKTIIAYAVILIMSANVGYIFGKIFYEKRWDLLAEEMDLKSQMIYELTQKGKIFNQIKEGNYKEASEAHRELKFKQDMVNREFDKRIAKVRRAAWGLGTACFLISVLLGWGLWSKIFG
jgi:hypothetical protein